MTRRYPGLAYCGLPVSFPAGRGLSSRCTVTPSPWHRRRNRNWPQWRLRLALRQFVKPSTNFKLFSFKF